MIKKLLSIVVLNLLIGNVIAWFMGAAPIDFAVVDYAADEQQLITELTRELADTPDDTTLLTQLGAMYSLHNHLDDAEHLLSSAVKLDADNALAIAWLSGTRAKQAGAMFDPAMGLYKLYSLRAACADLNQAVAADSNNFEIRMVRLATFAPTALLNCSLETAFADESWFKQYFATRGASAPTELKLQFYLAMIKAYANAGGSDNLKQAQQYLARFKQMADGVTLAPLVKHEMALASLLLPEKV